MKPMLAIVINTLLLTDFVSVGRVGGTSLGDAEITILTKKRGEKNVKQEVKSGPRRGSFHLRALHKQNASASPVESETLVTRNEINGSHRANGTLPSYKTNSTIESDRAKVRGCISNYSALEVRLSSAYDGESIALCPGTIHVSRAINCYANAVSLHCGGQANSCVLKKFGHYAGRILNSWGSELTVDGIAFQNGNNWGGNGGALLVDGDGPNTITRCSFSNNHARNGGAVFSTLGAYVEMKLTCFFHNHANGEGGAAYVTSIHTPTCTACYGDFNSASGFCESIRHGEEGCLPIPRIVGGQQGSGNCLFNFADLSDALSMASDGETILVCPGTINVGSEMSLLANDVTIKCDGTARSCILDKQGRVGRILNISGGRITIEGLVFRNANNEGFDGGAIIVSGTDENWIMDCEFYGNRAMNGGAIYCTRENAQGTTIQNSSFKYNWAARTGGAACVFTARGLEGNSGQGNVANYCKDLYHVYTGLCHNFGS